MAAADSRKRFTESVVWIEKMLPQIHFEAEEVDYKLAYAKRMRAVRELWREDSPNWSSEFINALQPSNLLNWRYESELVRLAETNRERLNVLLRLVWKQEPTASQFDSFVTQLREFSYTFTSGVATAVTSVLLMVHEGDNYPPYRPVAVHRFWKIMHWSPFPKERSTPHREYMHFLKSLRTFQSVARSSSLAVDNLIRVQGYMWLITEWDPRTAVPSNEVAAFKGWRGDTSGAVAEEETAASQRAAVLTKLQQSQQQLYSKEELLEFEVGSANIPLIDDRRVAVTPREFRALLTLSVPASSIVPADAASGAARIRFPRRSHNLKHFQDQALLQAIELNVLIIILAARGDQDYQPIHPVRVSRYVHKDHEFVLELSNVYLPLEMDDAARKHVRRWAATTAWQRIHQPMFRRDVMHAYGSRCAVCGLDVPALLDAAHIVPNSETGGIASVSNGLALCRVHHRAFDANLMGIDERCVIHVAPQVMSGSYGASVESYLRCYDGRRLQVVPATALRPKTELLQTAWARFQRADASEID